MDCMLKMKQIYTQLTAKERLVADYIQAFPNQAVSLSVQELAIRSQSSTASVMRMVKKLGYDSFPIFKIELAKSGEPKEPPRDFIIKCKDSLPLISKKIHHATENAIRELVNTLDFRKLSAAVEKLRHAERIFLLGTGGSGIPASDLYQKLVRIDRQVIFHPDLHLQVSTAALSRPGDAAVIFSYSGNTAEVNHAARLHKQNGAYLLGVTHATASVLSKLCDVCCYLPNTEGNLRLGAITSRYTELYISDLLYLAITQYHFEATKKNILRTREAIASLNR